MKTGSRAFVRAIVSVAVYVVFRLLLQDAGLYLGFIPAVICYMLFDWIVEKIFPDKQ